MTKSSNQPFLAIAGGVFAVVLSGIASAQTSGAPSPSYPNYPGSSASPSGSISGVSETVATQLISSTSVSQMLAISSAISFRAGGAFQIPPGARADSGQRFGMAAGGGAQMWNAWGSVSRDTFKYTPMDRKLETTNAVAGADFSLNPTLTLGLSAASDRSVGTLFGTTTTGYTFAPYLGWQINKDWSLDGIVGWGKGDTNGVKPDRFFYGSNLSYTTWAGNLQFSGKGSYLYGEEKYGTLSVKNKISQWRLGGRIGYWMDGFLPYVALTYTADSQETASAGTNNLGENAILSSVGVDLISLKNNLAGGIVFSSESGRNNSQRNTLMANINYRF